MKKHTTFAILSMFAIGLPACAGETDSQDDSKGPGGKADDIDEEDGPLEQVDSLEAMKILGTTVTDPADPGADFSSRRCAACHSVNMKGLNRWKTITTEALASCDFPDPDDLSKSKAQDAVACFRKDPDNEDSAFTSKKLGIYALGVSHDPRYKALFEKAFGDSGSDEFDRFVEQVEMPRGTAEKLTVEEFIAVRKWFRADPDSLPDIQELLGDHEPPAPLFCAPSFDSQFWTDYLEEKAKKNWSTINADNDVRMFGCDPGEGHSEPQNCLTDADDVSSAFGVDSIAGLDAKPTLRRLKTLDTATNFWMRTSADGRFVGNGGSPSSVTDLLKDETILVPNALFDPGFFPDNSGFMFQGFGARICDQSVLTKDTDQVLTLTETGCIGTEIGLYQHMARALGDDGHYFIVNGQFTSDVGDAVRDPMIDFSAQSQLTLTPLTFNGTGFEPQEPALADIPFEGDGVLSPSGGYVVNREAGQFGGLGYVIREVNAKQQSSGDFTVDVDTKVAVLCDEDGQGHGTKPGMSFDERFMAFHHYEDGTANIYVYDLLRDEKHKVTDMPSGERALFPHFVSNGWIYFLSAETTGQGRQHVMASDLAVQIALEDPTLTD